VLEKIDLALYYVFHAKEEHLSLHRSAFKNIAYFVHYSTLFKHDH